MLSELVKLRISCFATLSALAAFFSTGHGAGPAPIVIGVFLLACGACALNEYQERGSDGLMERTEGRPIPSGRISPANAALAAVSLLAAGILLVSLAGGRQAGLLGLAGVLWYNTVYTPLKRATPFAAVAGSLVGAAPPAIGWVAAGGSLSDARLLALCFFFCLWQVPHFWLLVPEYGPELERAGIRSLTGVMGQARVRRLICVWMSLSASSCLLFPLFGSIGSLSACFLLAGAACWLTWKSARLLLVERAPGAFREAFATINAFALLVMGLLAADPYLARMSYHMPF